METLTSIIRAAVAALLAPLGWGPPIVGLTIFSLLSGALMLWALKKTSRQSAMQIARDRMAASVYEVRLFIDSPRQILGAQWRLLFWSLRYVGYMLPTFLVLTPPLALLYPQLEIRYGLSPVPVGEPVLVEVGLLEGTDGYQIAPEAEQSGLRITAPPLYVEEEAKVYLRMVVTEPGTHTLSLRAGDEVVTKEVSAEPGLERVSPERVGGWLDAFAFGTEDPLPAESGVAYISIPMEEKDQRWLWLPIPWWAYWLGVSILAALLLKKPMGVVF